MDWNPPPPPGHDRQRRRYAKDDVDHNGMDAHGIHALGERLRTMNPYALGNPRGVCETCAWETVGVLLTGRKPRPVFKIDPPNDKELADWHEPEQERWESLKMAERKGKLLKAPDAPRAQAFGEHRLNEIYPGFAERKWKHERKFQPEPNRATTVFAWLSQAEHGEVVFVADGGGHVWNYLRVAGRLFLLDVSTSLFCELTRGGDGRAKYWSVAASRSRSTTSTPFRSAGRTCTRPSPSTPPAARSTPAGGACCCHPAPRGGGRSSRRSDAGRPDRPSGTTTHAA